ncbi:MAG: hypothetical protein ACC652_11980, partial [Acidimicrobiales bacterium]
MRFLAHEALAGYEIPDQAAPHPRQHRPGCVTVCETLAVSDDTGFPERTDYTVGRGSVTANPIKAIEQRQQVDRETRRVAESPPAPPASRPSRFKRLTQALKGPGYKCRVCSELD